jgi:hypothetical protein
VAARIWNENGGLIEALAQRYDIRYAIIGVIGTSAVNFDKTLGSNDSLGVREFHRAS